MKKIFLILFSLLFFVSTSFAQTLDEKIGQMIILGFEGDNIKAKGFKKVQKQVQKGEISGVILFGKNIKSKQDLTLMNETLLKANPNNIPFIAIDNEGGEIQRHSFENIKSAKTVSYMDFASARYEYFKMANLLKDLNINLNFAPCVDLEINPNSIIAKKERSYGVDSYEVAKFASIFIEEHNKKGIITSIKHFPGHGSIEGDTHLGFVDASKTFIDDEIEPYYFLSKYQDKNMVIVSHIFNSKFDDKYPASLSEKTIKEYLIDKVGFNGVIISDDYDMGAIRKEYQLRDIIVNSINSGVNILLFSNNIETNEPHLASKIKKIIKDEVGLGNIKMEDIDNSYRKITALKRTINQF